MKKLMILTALLASGVMAFGDGESWQNVFDASDYKATMDDWTSGWSGATDKAQLDTTKNVLKIETSQAALKRVTDPSNEPTGVAIVSNLYFDVTLNLLGQAIDVESIPTTTQLDGAKLALFLMDTKSAEDMPDNFGGHGKTGTNLWAIVKNTVSEDGDAMLVRLSADPAYLLDTTQTSRLTVKAYKNVLQSSSGNNAGFMIYQDGGKSTDKVDPLTVMNAYAITDGQVVWGTELYDENDFQCDIGLTSSLTSKRTSVLLSLEAGDEGAQIHSLDFSGNAEISRVEMNEAGFGFIAADTYVTTITAGEGMTIAADPASAYDADTGAVTASCTITVTLDDDYDILTPEPANATYLTETGVSGKVHTFSYTYAERNDVTFSAATACVTLNGTGYASLADALTAGGEEGGTLVLKRDLRNDDLDTLDYKCIVLTGTWTLDLAGKNIVGTGNQSDSDSLGVVYLAEGSLVITNSTTTLGSIKTMTTDGIAVCCGADNAGMSIYGGIIDGSIRDIALESEEEEVTPNVTIYGGRFTVEPDEKWIPEGYSLSTDTDDSKTYYVVSEGTETTSWATLLGEKGDDGFYTIDDETDLIALQDNAKALGTKDFSFKLTADITLSKQWNGIGMDKASDFSDTTYAFEGTFDGNGKTISGLVFANANSSGSYADGNNYRGLFGCVNGGTIKNLTVAGSGFGSESLPSGEYGCAMIVGELVSGTIEGCTSKGMIASASHNAAGICVKMTGAGSVIKSCTNTATIVGNYTKIGGILAFNQSSKAACTIEDCVNEGSVTADGSNGPYENQVPKAGKDGCGGIVGWCGDSYLTIKNCSNTGTISATSASQAKVGQMIGSGANAVTVEGTNTGLANQVAIGVLASGVSADGLLFATVDSDTATFCASSAVKLDGTYKVMTAGATYTMTALGSITFDTTLATVTVSQGGEYTDTDKYEITEKADATSEKVITYTLAAKATVTPVDPGTAQTCDSENDANTLAAAINKDKTNLINVPSGLDENQKTTYLGLVEAKVVTTEGATTTYSVVVDFTADATTTIQTQVDTDVKALKVANIAAATADTTSSITTTPGVYYSVIAGSTLDGMAVRSSTMATDTSMNITLPKYEGAGFYTIEATVNQQEVATE